MPGATLGTGNSVMIKTKSGLRSHGVYSQVRRQILTREANKLMKVWLWTWGSVTTERGQFCASVCKLRLLIGPSAASLPSWLTESLFCWRDYWAQLEHDFSRPLLKMTQWVKNLPVMQETQEMQVLSLGPLEKGTARPLQFSCLENSMDRGTWQVPVHGVAMTEQRTLFFTTEPPRKPQRDVGRLPKGRDASSSFTLLVLPRCLTFQPLALGEPLFKCRLYLVLCNDLHSSY